MAKHKIRNLKVLKQIFEVSMKILCPQNGKEKFFPNNFSFLSNLKNAKTNMSMSMKI